VLGITPDQYSKITAAIRASNHELDTLVASQREAVANLEFTKAVSNIESFNKGLDRGITLQGHLIALMGRFDDQSIRFRNQAAKDRLALVEKEIDAEVKKAAYAKQEYDSLQKTLRGLEKKTVKKDQQAALDAEIAKIQDRLVEAAAAGQSLPDLMDKFQTSLAEASLEASAFYRHLLANSKLFNDRIAASADAVAGFFSSLPNAIVGRFDEMKQLEQDLLDVQTQIEEEESAKSMGKDFADAERELTKLRDKEKELNEELSKAKSLTRALGQEFANLGASVGQSLLDVQTEQFKESLQNIFADIFGSKEEERRKVLYDVIKRAHRDAEVSLKKAIRDGHYEGLRPFYGAPGTGSLDTSTGIGALSSSISDAADAWPGSDDPRRRIGGNRGATDFSDLISQQQRLAGEEADKFRDIKNAATALATLAAVSTSTAIGGGGQGAAIGAQVGSIGFALPPPWNFIVGPLTTVLGGLLGGIFDDAPEKKLAEEYDKNTKALERNTAQLNDLRAELINAPARFVLPAQAGMTFTGGGQAGASPVSPEAPSVTVVFQGNVSGNQESVRNAVVDGVTQAYQESHRRFGRRVTR
jgi:hypothetical protein